jgi:hypothetical protein
MEWSGIYWIHMAQDKDQLQALMNMITIHQVL